MPHQCTTCDRTFPDGSKEMLSGCPDCGGNKFQFKPKGDSTDGSSTPSDVDEQGPSGVDEQEPSNQISTSQPSSSADTSATSSSPSDSPLGGSSPGDSSRDDSSPDGPSPGGSPPGSSRPGEPNSNEAPLSDSSRAAQSGDTEHVRERSDEDTAQANARSDVVSPDELDEASRDVDSVEHSERPDSQPPEEHRPDIGELRDELNEQFESIRIVSPGKYELNLMELYDRQEYIISLQEDGRYVIEMPDAWGISDE